MARKENRTTKEVKIAQVGAYHDNGHGRMEHSETYAQMGFEKGFKLRTTDRWIDISEDGQTLVTGKPVKGYGIEIETECFTIYDQTTYANLLTYAIFPHFPANLFKLQRDGSLEGNSSAEIISQPMTKEALRNLYPAFKAMYDELFPAFGISCTSTGNCGMHVNISTACMGTTKQSQEESIRKLFYVINRHYDLFLRVFNRDEDHDTFYYLQMVDYQHAKTINLNSSLYAGHHVCFNLGHYEEGRIEIRLVGGQSSFETFRATVETIFHLVERMKRISWNQLDDIVSIFDGCNQHVAERICNVGRIDENTKFDIRHNSKPVPETF